MIVVGGMKRSGTTWMFNVIRVALDHAGKAYTVTGSLAEAKKPSGLVLLKSHWHRGDVAAQATKVFTSDRNVIEVFQSLERLWGRPPTGRELAKIVEHYRRWDRIADYRMPYGRLIEEPQAVVTEICMTLDLPVNPVRVFAEVSAIEPPKEGQDPVTLYFSNHRA